MGVHILGRGLAPEKVAELVNIIRRNFLYQTPRPREDNPNHVQIYMLGKDWARMLVLAEEHGGWTLPQDVIEAIQAGEPEDDDETEN